MFTTDPKDLPIVIKDGDLQVRGADHGGMTLAHFKLPRGTDMGPALKGLPGDTCACPDWGYMIKGTVRMHTDGGSQDFKAGQVFYWGPGHAPEALEDAEYVDLSPTEDCSSVLITFSPALSAFP